MGQNFAFSMLNTTMARKKYTTASCVVGTIFSCAQNLLCFGNQVQNAFPLTKPVQRLRRLERADVADPANLAPCQIFFLSTLKCSQCFLQKSLHTKSINQPRHRCALDRQLIYHMIMYTELQSQVMFVRSFSFGKVSEKVVHFISWGLSVLCTLQY